MMVTVRRKYIGPRVHEQPPKRATSREQLHKLVAQLTALWGSENAWLAQNVAWWRYRNGRSLVVKKVLP